MRNKRTGGGAFHTVGMSFSGFRKNPRFGCSSELAMKNL